MNLTIQKVQEHNPRFTLDRLSPSDTIQINIDDKKKKYTFHIEMEQLKNLLLKSDCFQLISK